MPSSTIQWIFSSLHFLTLGEYLTVSWVPCPFNCLFLTNVFVQRQYSLCYEQMKQLAALARRTHILVKKWTRMPAMIKQQIESESVVRMLVHYWVDTDVDVSYWTKKVFLMFKNHTNIHSRTEISHMLDTHISKLHNKYLCLVWMMQLNIIMFSLTNICNKY